MPVRNDYPLGAGIDLNTLAGDFHGHLAVLRTHEPITWVPAFQGWLVTAHALVATVLRDPVRFTVDDPRFSTGRVIGPSMLSLDGAAHVRHRAPFEQAFRRGNPASLSARMRSAADALVSTLQSDGQAELRSRLAAPLAVNVMIEALGLVNVDAAELLAWYSDIVASTTAATLGAQPSQAGADALAKLAVAVDRSLQCSPLLAAARGTLSRDEVVANVAVLLFGGIETSEAMTTNALLHLLEQPSMRQMLVEQPSLIAAFVEESVRLEPAAAQLDRYATQPVTLGGAVIAAGDFVMCSIAAANRDPLVFAEPERFIVGRRSAATNLAFAQGPHACLANHIARAETHAALSSVLSSLDELRLDLLAAPPRVEGVVFRKAPKVSAHWNPS